MSPDFKHKVVLFPLLLFLIIKPKIWFKVILEAHVEESDIICTFSHEESFDRILGVPDIEESFLNHFYFVKVVDF